MGLGGVNRNNGVFLSIAGGFIWNKKSDESDPNYATQTYEKADGTSGVRKGAQYQDLTGRITNVKFHSHAEYGDSLNVTVEDGEDAYVLSVGIDGREGSCLMKGLLVMDFNKLITIKPYDFVGQDSKRVKGISFTQEGEKLNLMIEGQPNKPKEWFKEASKRELKRFFDDVTDYFIDRIKKEVIPQFSERQDQERQEKENTPATGAVVNRPEAKPDPKPEVKPEVKADPKPEVKAEKPTATETPSLSPLQMKKFIKSYIDENYPGREMPALKGEELIKWYNLALAVDELPFDAPIVQNDAAKGASLENQLDALLGK